MIRINEHLSISFCIHDNKKVVELRFTGAQEPVYIYHPTFEVMVKHFFKHKAEIGDYPTLSRLSDTSTEMMAPVELK